MTLILAIDPGAVNTGIVMLHYDSEKRKANLTYMGILSKDQVDMVYSLLAKNEGYTVVIEDFKHAYATGNFRGRKSTAMTQRELETNRLAKKIRTVAELHNHKVVLQQPAILAMGRKWCDFPLPKGHIPDDKSAYIHGVHFLISTGKIDSPKDVTKFGQETID